MTNVKVFLHILQEGYLSEIVDDMSLKFRICHDMSCHENSGYVMTCHDKTPGFIMKNIQIPI